MSFVNILFYTLLIIVIVFTFLTGKIAFLYFGEGKYFGSLLYSILSFLLILMIIEAIKLSINKNSL